MESLLTQITNYLLSQSWQIAVLTTVIAFITFLLRNKSAHVRYLLWMIVLAKCLIPPLYTISIAILPEKEAPAYVSAPPMAESTISEYRVPDITVTESPKPASVRYETRALLAIGWLIGVAALTFYYLVNALRTQIWLHKRRKELPSEYKKSIESIFFTYGIRRMPSLWLLEKINQPFVWGLVRGSIYLPAELINEKHANFHTSLIGHELSHVIRFDALINSLQVIAQTIFWFHPFIWWTNRKIRQEREKCCDEMTIARLNTLPEDYSEAIVEILAAKYVQVRRVPSLAVAGKVKNIEERIKTMLKPGKKFYKRPSLVAATVILLLALVTIPIALVLTARGQSQPTNQSADKPVQSLTEAATDSKQPEPPRFAARTFNSQLAFYVGVQEICASERHSIGRTPSPAALDIPSCWLWSVAPPAPVTDWDSLAQEMSQNAVPGLGLSYWATDSDMKHVADLIGLQGLELAGCKITDVGMEHLKGHMTGLRLLDLSYTRVTDTGLAHLKGLTGLQWLSIEGPDSPSLPIMRITDAGMEHLKDLTGLRVLRLAGTQITDVGIEHLKGLTGLQWLDLHSTRITDTGLVHLKDMAGLQELWLMKTQITDAGLVHLKGLSRLQSLVLWNTQTTDAGMEHLQGMTGLRELGLNATQITDAGIEHLKGLTGLNDLSLCDTQVTDAGMEHLRIQTGLENLSLSGTKVTDAGLEHLKGLTRLRDMSLPAQITDAGVEHLKSLRELQFLDLSDTQITNSGLVHLEGLSGLQQVWLRNTKITDAGIAHLKGLANLYCLLLDNTQITDAGLANLKGLAKMKELRLSSTQITDTGLTHLNGLTGLQRLDLSGTKVTDAGIQKLKQSLPNLTIYK